MGERAPGVWERKDKNTGTGNICQSIHPSLPVHHSCVLSDWRILLSPMCVRAGRRACASSVALQVCSVHQITNNWDDRNVLQRQRWLFLRNGTRISLQTGQSSVESPVLHCPLPVVAWRKHPHAVLLNWENIRISFCYSSIWSYYASKTWHDGTGMCCLQANSFMKLLVQSQRDKRPACCDLPSNRQHSIRFEGC